MSEAGDAPEGGSGHIFISYARADRERVAPLVAALEARGRGVWWDSHLAGGATYAREIEAALPPDTPLLLISDHGFGPIDWYVNFNVWLLGRGDIALQDSFYVRQKGGFWDRGVTPGGL